MAFLFWSLVLYILLSPRIFSQLPGHVVLAVGFLLILITGVYAVSTRNHHRLIALVLGAPFIIAYLFSELLDTAKDTPTILMTFGIPFFLYVTYRMLMFVVHARRVTSEELHAAASVYLLFGFSWAGVYGLVAYFDPASFSNLSQAHEVARDQLFYYSFVTLTTLGYGDITPQGEFARHLAILEAITGVLSLSFLIARIVSSYRSED